MEPHQLHPGLTWHRLNVVASVLATARNAAVKRHAPRAGENAWSLGVTSHARSIHAVQRAAEFTDGWLSIFEPSLHFRFAVAGVPMGFYKGGPRSPKLSALKRMALEQRLMRQLRLFDQATMDLYRIAVQTAQDKRVSDVHLVRMDDDRQVLDIWPLDFSIDLETHLYTPASAFAPAIAVAAVPPASSVVTSLRVPAKKLPRAVPRRKGDHGTGTGSVDE